MRCDPCLNYAETFSHPQVLASNILSTLEHPARGTIKVINPPIQMEKTPIMPRSPTPLLGQHTKEILKEYGYTDQEVQELIDLKVVNARETP